MILKFKQFEGERYDNILKGYGKDYDDLSKKRGVKPNEEGYFEELPSKGIAEELLEEYYKPGFKLLDIGCGLGNILKMGNEIGYQSTGIEINEELKKYHNDLNVIYGDVLKMDLRFIREFDIIYLYRPIGSLDKCDDLFQKIYDNCKDSCIIIYLYPSQLELNIKRKFEYKMFPIMNSKYENDENGKMKLIIIETKYKTEYKYIDKYNEYYSIMKPKRGVNDINVKQILQDIKDNLSEYRKRDIKWKHSYGAVCNDFGCKGDQSNFIKLIKQSFDTILKYNIDVDFDVEIKKDKKSKTIRFDKYNRKMDLQPSDGKILNLSILYHEIKGRIYENWNIYSNGYG